MSVLPCFCREVAFGMSPTTICEGTMGELNPSGLSWDLVLCPRFIFLWHGLGTRHWLQSYE